jgi:hypothetical protein
LAIVLYFGGTNRLYWTCWTKKRHKYTHPHSTTSLIGLKDNDSFEEAVFATAGNKRLTTVEKLFIYTNVSIKSLAMTHTGNRFIILPKKVYGNR